MTTPEAALVEIAGALADLRIPYMVIGGVANAVWGEPRSTLDVDVTVWVAEPELDAVVAQLVAKFRCRVARPAEFVRGTRVLPLQSARGERIDVVFGMLPFEEEAIRRAVTVRVAGADVRFCTAEDLVLHKIVSERERDLNDARAITRRRLAQLDLAYLEPRIEELSQGLERPEITARWQAWKQEAGGTA